MLSLRKYVDPVLTQKCLPVEEFNDSTRRLIEDMFELMTQSAGQGLAASQVGVLQRVIVMRVEETEYAIVNPEVISARGSEEDEEGCLSIPGLKVDIPRATSLRLKGLDRDGNVMILKAKGHLARVIQHEIDHLNGKLIVDYLPKGERLNFDLNYIEALQSNALDLRS